MAYDNERQSRFGSGMGVGAGMGSSFGYDDLGAEDPLDRKYLRRNIKQYKTLKPYAKKGGFKKLRGKNAAQIERLAVKAVLQKNKVKRKKLNRRVNRKKYGTAATQKAKSLLSQGYGRRVLGQHAQGEQIKDIPLGTKKYGRKVRRAMQHITKVRRNRAIMKTPLMMAKGYDLRMGHISLPQAKRRNYWRKKK